MSKQSDAASDQVMGKVWLRVCIAEYNPPTQSVFKHMPPSCLEHDARGLLVLFTPQSSTHTPRHHGESPLYLA